MTIIYRHVAGAIIGACVAGGTAHGQQRPDLSGTWAAQADSAQAAGAPRSTPVYGPEFSIRQDARSLVITRRIGEASVTMTHPLDASEMRVRMPARLCEGDGESVFVADWDGAAARVALVGSVPPGGGQLVKRDVKWTFRLDAPDALTVQMVAAAAGQAPPRTSSTVYTRTGAPANPPAEAQVQRARATLSQLEWLGGVWVGTAGSSQVEERWTPPAGGSMLAVARSLRNGLMNSFEFLCIVERQGGLVYTAMPNGRQPATDFTLTAIDADSATFANPTHDFPRMIKYTRKPDGTLEAVISGDATQRSQTFVFKKQQ